MPDLKRLETGLKRLQQSLNRKRRGSRRRGKQRIRVQRASRRLRNARRNWQHHVSRRIAKMAQTVVIEKLHTRGMTKSARGTTDRPGTNVRQMESRHSPYRLGSPEADARIQGSGTDRGTRGLHFANLFRLRHHRPAVTQVAKQIPVRGMRPRAERGPECGPRYPGVGDWRCCTARSVRSHSSDP